MNDPGTSRTRAAWLMAATLWPALLVRAAAADVHEYSVTVDDALSRLVVEARFVADVETLAARSNSAASYLLDARSCDDAHEIEARERRMTLPAGGISCLNYTVDLARAVSEYRSNGNLDRGNAVASPSLWLWRPDQESAAGLNIRFRLPDAVRVSAPWPALPPALNSYYLGASPQSSHAPVAFGNFHYEEIEVPGARLRVAMLNGTHPMDRAGIANWLRAAATDVTLAYGRFPNPSPQILVVPVGDSRSDSAVPFGRVIRDGGETVELFVNQNMPLPAFLDDWTATHEFSHLMLPYVGRRYRWISEGFAQYYQNVLLARAGSQSALRSWQKLHEGFERGRRARPDLSPNEVAGRRSRNGLMKMYWSGAAMALLADVALREASGGERSLDSVLARLQSCCLPSDRSWSGPELFSRLDALSGTDIFMDLYRQHADTPGFPDTREVFGRLGLAVADGEVRIVASAELTALREAMTRENPEVAAWRRQLATKPAL